MSVPLHASRRPSHSSLAQRFALVAFPAVCCFLSGCQSHDPWHLDVADTLELTHWESHRADTFTRECGATEEFATVATRPDWGGFEQHYVEDILALGPVAEDSTWEALSRFSNHMEIRRIGEAIDSAAAPHVLKSEAALHDAFRRFHHFFPNEPTPDLVWMNSAFVHAIYPTPQHLAIGLDWFLGADHPLYATLPPHLFPNYIQQRMRPEFIVADAMRGWLLVHFGRTHFDPEHCADALLFYGKIMFILSRLLPDSSPAVLMDWSAEDLAWAQANESGIWLELMPREMLYMTNEMEYNRWFHEAPFTRIGDIPQESPDRLGLWMGWQIVEAYMEENPEWTLEELMGANDPLILLKTYRP